MLGPSESDRPSESDSCTSQVGARLPLGATFTTALGAQLFSSPNAPWKGLRTEPPRSRARRGDPTEDNEFIPTYTTNYTSYWLVFEIKTETNLVL